jgi:hypothetical protein
MKRFLLFLLLLLPISASAQFNGCAAGFCAPVVASGGGGGSAPTLDPSGGFSSTFSGTTNGSVTFSTTNASMLFVVVGCEVTNATGVHRTVSSVSDNSGTTGTWASIPGGVTHAPKNYLDNSGATAAYNSLEIWAANAPLAITSKSITVTLSGTVDDCVLIAFGADGANTTTPGDTNASIAGLGAYAGGFTAPTVTGVSTTATNTFMIFAYQSVSNTDAGDPTGFTRIAYANNGGGSNNCELGVSYQRFSSTQSSATYTSATAGINGWTAVALAIKS